MRPPIIESAALLAAHGHAAPIPFKPRRLPAMHGVRFALIPMLDAATKPVVFATIDLLAQAIQRRRNLRGLQMIDIDDLEIPYRPGPTPAVQLYALDADGAPVEMLGYAYLDGHGQDALRAALRRNPAVQTQERAA